MRKRISLVLALVLVLSLGISFARAQDKKVIKIASQSPLSGGQSVLGTGLRNGAEMAISQLSGPLSDLGYDIQFVPFDDQATPDVGVANAQQIVADASILAVIGHFNSGVAIPSSEVYNANNLVMVSPANTNPNVTDRGLPTVNRVCGRDDLQGPTGAKFAATLEGVSSVYVLHDTTTYGQGVAQFFADSAPGEGLTVLGFEGTSEKSNFESVIQPIIALEPDVVYFGGIYDQVGIFVNQLRAAGYTGKVMGPDGFDSPDYAKLAGDGGVGTFYTSAAGPVSAFPTAAQFAADYNTQYGGAPTPYAAESYDATAIVLLALEATVKDLNGELPTREAVSTAVRATKGYAGLTGEISFDGNGDRELANYYIFEVGSSDPEKWGENAVVDTLQLPSPLYAMELAEATPEATASS